MEATEAAGVGTALAQVLFGYVLTIVVGFAVAGIVYVIVRALTGSQAKTAAAAQAARLEEQIPRMATADEETARHVAAIAAAVAVVARGARIVHIGDETAGPAWRTSGRAAVHTSHSPRRIAR